MGALLFPSPSQRQEDIGIGGVVSLLWFRRRLPPYVTKFIEMVRVGNFRWPHHRTAMVVLVAIFIHAPCKGWRGRGQ